MRKGDYLSVTRETGNQWNCLMIRIDEGHVGRPTCVPIEGHGSWPERPLLESEVVDAVLSGILEANERLGTSYKVSHVRYVDNDSPPESIYSYLASSLINRLHRGDEFRIGAPVED